MNDDFLNKAKRAADVVNDKLKSPEVQSAIKETRVQTERAIGELGGLLNKVKRAIQYDIDKRP